MFIVQNGWFGIVDFLSPQEGNGSGLFHENNHLTINELVPDKKSKALLLTVGTLVVIVPVVTLWTASYTSFLNNSESTFILLVSFGIGVLFALLFSTHYRNQRKKFADQPITVEERA